MEKFNQQGFSALGLFLLALAMILIMSFSGIFTYHKSEIADKEAYEAVRSTTIEGNGLLMTDLDMRIK